MWNIFPGQGAQLDKVMEEEILIVDDDEKILFVLQESLKRVMEDCVIETASSGFRALQIAEEKQPKLLITDLMLGDTDGIRLTQAMRILHPELIVIWITAYGCHSVIGQAEKLGIFRCMDKPISIQQIRQVVFEAMDSDHRQ